MGEGRCEHCSGERESTGDTGVRRSIKRDARQAARELKRREQKEKKLVADKKKKEEEERLRRKGRKTAKGQPKITIWLNNEKARTTPLGERTGVG